MQTQTIFSLLQIFLEVSRVCHMKADVLPFLKIWWFLYYNFLHRSYCCSKSGQIWRFSLESGVVKQKYALKNFLKTDPLEKSFKIGFWKFSQEDLSWKIFWARMYFITTHNYYEKNQNFRHRWLWAAIT